MNHLNEAIKITKENKLEEAYKSIIQKNIPFIAANFKRVDGITSNDKSEQAHIEIAKGNHDKAVAILESTTMDSPFKLYYLGLAKQDEAILDRKSTRLNSSHVAI